MIGYGSTLKVFNWETVVITIYTTTIMRGLVSYLKGIINLVRLYKKINRLILNCHFQVA